MDESCFNVIPLTLKNYSAQEFPRETPILSFGARVKQHKTEKRWKGRKNEQYSFVIKSRWTSARTKLKEWSRSRKSSVRKKVRSPGVIERALTSVLGRMTYEEIRRAQ